MCSLLLALILFLVPALNSVHGEEVLKIGILQSAEHSAFDDNREGILEGLEKAGYVDGDTITVDYQNAGGDMATMQSMGQTLVEESDYVFALGTAALQAVANAGGDTPVIFVSSTDPVGAGAIESVEKPGGNITGVSNLGPIKEQLELIKEIFPDAKKVGIFYNSGEVNAVYQAEQAKEIAKELGLETVDQTISSTNDIQQNLTSLVGQVDAIFVATDNTIHSAMNLVGEIAKSAGLGIFGGSINMIEENGLATYGLDYKDLGIQAADMFVRIHEEGLNPGEVPVEYAKELKLYVNDDYAKELGLDLSDLEKE